MQLWIVVKTRSNAAFLSKDAASPRRPFVVHTPNNNDEGRYRSASLPIRYPTTETSTTQTAPETLIDHTQATLATK